MGACGCCGYQGSRRDYCGKTHTCLGTPGSCCNQPRSHQVVHRTSALPTPPYTPEKRDQQSATRTLRSESPIAKLRTSKDQKPAPEPKCQATLKSGKRCTFRARPGQKTCGKQAHIKQLAPQKPGTTDSNRKGGASSRTVPKAPALVSDDEEIDEGFYEENDVDEELAVVTSKIDLLIAASEKKGNKELTDTEGQKLFKLVREKRKLEVQQKKQRKESRGLASSVEVQQRNGYADSVALDYILGHSLCGYVYVLEHEDPDVLMVKIGMSRQTPGARERDYIRDLKKKHPECRLASTDYRFFSMFPELLEKTAHKLLNATNLRIPGVGAVELFEMTVGDAGSAIEHAAKLIAEARDIPYEWVCQPEEGDAEFLPMLRGY